MHRLAELSLRQRALIALVTLAVGLFGVISMSSLKQELFPSLSLPIVSVTAQYPGAAPDVVDAEVAQPIEAAMQGLEGLESTSSTSTAGMASIRVSFAYGTDLVYAEQRIGQALSRIDDRLPDGVTTNVLSGSVSDLPIIQLAATGGDRTALADRIRNQTIPDLLKLDGVRDATLSGAPERRIAITPNLEALAANGLTTQAISDALKNSGVLVPAGTITQGDETLTVQAGSLLHSADDVAAIPLSASSGAGGAASTTRPSTPVTIGQVATVRLEDKPVESISRVNGEQALTIAVTKTPASNTVDVSREVRAQLEALQADLGQGVTLRSVYDQAPFVEQSIETLIVEGLLGLLFAVAVIWAFLRSFRSTLVTAISIPTSLLITFIALQGAKYSLNILTLGALTIAIGRVVDDSIVVIENIRRHLGPEGEPRPAERRAIIIRAVREVAGAITASTIATVAVYLPIAFVGDIAGELFRPFALTSVIALLASLIVSLTIVPVLAYWLLGGRGRTARALLRGRGSRGSGGSGLAPAPLPVGETPLAGADGSLVEPRSATVSAPAPVGAASVASEEAPMRRIRPKKLLAQRDRDRFAPLGLRDEEPAEEASAAVEPAASAASAESAAPATLAAPAFEAEPPAAQAFGAEALGDLESDDPAPARVGLSDEDRALLAADVATLTRRERRRRDELEALAAEEAEAAPTEREAGAVDAPPLAARSHASLANAELALAPMAPHADAAADERALATTGSGPDALSGTASAADLAAADREDARRPEAPRLAAGLGPLHDHDEAPDGLLQRGYAPILRWTLRRPLATLGAALLILVLTGALAPLMQTNFLGSAGQSTLSISQSVPPNASLDAVDARTKPVEQAILAEPGVETVQLTYGGSSLMRMFAGGGSSARYSVTVADDADPAKVQAALEERLGQLPDVGKLTFGQSGAAGFSDSLEIDLDAPTTEALQQASDAVLAALDGREGIVSASSSLSETRPFVRIDIDRTAAAQAGLSELAIGGIVAQHLMPVPVGQVMIDGGAVKVELVPGSQPATIDEIRAIQIPSATGMRPLSELAQVAVVDGPVQITAERGTPTATITVVPSGEDLKASNAALQAALDEAQLPTGAHASIGGVSKDQAESFAQLGLALLAAILIVYIVMVATFRSLLQPLLLLISVPFAATGAIFLLIAAGVPLGLPSLIGVLMLVGIVVTNAIVLIDLVNQFRERGMGVEDAIVEGGARRVRPIVMTALATILALTPMALGITGHGGFISQPLAIVVIGGLLSSTVLTLLVLPALYKAVETPRERRRARRDAELAAEAEAAPSSSHM
ncbi:Swarming motility protein SwrC [Pseudoclavibacter triregionum]|nr:Swarming motility protein SwrC [Pseudoclavibacter triregionum]